jgi:hypothetical protein
MGEKPTVTKRWIVETDAEDCQIRCFLQRTGKIIELFTVQLELWYQEEWRPIVRYDNSHGFCHRDVLYADGTQEKEALTIQMPNEAFNFANRDVRINRDVYRERFLRKAGS